MNEVEIVFEDARSAMASLTLNGKPLQVGKVAVGKYKRDGFTQVRMWQVTVAIEQNRSNPLVINAPSVRTLVMKLKKYPHKLVRYSAIMH